MKKTVASILIVAMMILTLTGCGKSSVDSSKFECSYEGCTEQVYKNGLCPDHYIEVNGNTKTDDVEEYLFNEGETEEEVKEKEEAYEKSTAENDTDIGLKNIKFDTAKGSLTETEKLVAEYFNNDYLFVNSIEALQRYNKIFDKALIQSYVKVAKVLSYEEDKYELLVYMISGSPEMSTYDDYGVYGYGGWAPSECERPERFMIISGLTGDSRFIVGDIIQINGRYMDVTTREVDGVSITVPCIDVYRAYLIDPNDEYRWWYVEVPSRFSKKQVKDIAECIFGEDITIRNDKPEDYGEDHVGSDVFNYYGPCYVCELDNQSKSKFSKYFFNERYGTLVDAVHENYEISFAGDFKHFFLFMYDKGMETLTLEYYDNQLNKLWKREFENTVTASYDVTKNNIYLVADNEYYVINTETGEDTFESVYIGDKRDLRKFENGVLAISDKKADAFMYMGLDGKVLWRADADEDIDMYSAIQAQMIDDRIIISVKSYDEAKYYVIDKNDGTVVYSGNVDAPHFSMYR